MFTDINFEFGRWQGFCVGEMEQVLQKYGAIRVAG